MEGIFIDSLKYLLMELSASSALTKFLLVIIIILITYIGKFTRSFLKKIYSEVKYNGDYVTAMDTALEHSLKNGYAKARDERLELLNHKNARIESK